MLQEMCTNDNLPVVCKKVDCQDFIQMTALHTQIPLIKNTYKKLYHSVSVLKIEKKKKKNQAAITK